MAIAVIFNFNFVRARFQNSNSLYMLFKYKHLFVFVFFSVFFFSGNIQAQQISIDETINFINRILGDDVKLENKKGLTVSFYKNGEIYRRDIVGLEDLDPETIKYSEEEKYISIHCYSAAEGCVDRKLFESKIRRGYKRITFPADVDESRQKLLIGAFDHLIRLYSDPDYEGNGSFK